MKQGESYDRSIFGDDAKKGKPGRAASPGPVGKSKSLRTTQKAVIMPKRRMSLNMKMLIFAAIVFAGLAATAMFFLNPEEDRYVLDTYQIATVGTRDFRNVVTGSGRVTPVAMTVFTAPAAARVAEIYVEPGTDVEAGELLAVLVSDELQSELDRAQSEYDIAVIEADQARVQYEHQVDAAERDVERARQQLDDALRHLPVIEELFALGGVSQRELDEARNAVRAAEASLDEAITNRSMIERQADLGTKKAAQLASTAEEKLNALLERVDMLHVRASEAGRILESGVNQGDRVTQGATLFRLADVTKQVVETTVTPEQAQNLSTGGSAVIRTAGAQYPAIVTQVAALAVTGDQSTQVPVRLSMAPEISELFLPYAAVSVEIELGHLENRMYLPRGPFFSSGNASFVYVIDPSGETAQRRDVRYGAIDGNYLEIVSGLEPGDDVIYSSYTVYRSYPSIDLIPEGGRRVE